MLGFLKRLFFAEKEEFDSSNMELDEKNSYAEEKKNKLSTDHYVEDVFYIHEEPDPPYSRNNDNMPSQVTEQESVSSQVQIFDERTGQMVTMDANMAAGQLEQHAPGIMIPGIGHVGAGQRPQQRPQQPMQPRPQQPMQQRPVQQPQYVQQPPAQQPQPQYVQQPVQQPVPVQQAPRQIPVQQQAPQFPNIETAVTADTSYMFMDLSGVKRNTLAVSFNNGNLVISGKRESNLDILKDELTKKTKGRKKNPFINKVDTVPRYLKGAFTFEYPFARMIDESAIVATLEDGILKVVLPHRAKGEAVSVAIG